MSITKFHAEWLSLIEVSGPFLSLPILKKMFPQGLEAHDAEHARLLRQVHEEWDDNQRGLNPDPAIHAQWVRWVLRNTLELDEVLVEGQAIPQTIKAEIEEPQHRETLRPDLVLLGPDKKPRLLIQVYPLTQKLGRTVDGKPWKASPDTRMTQLLRDTGVQLGLVTNGDQWMLVYAPPTETSGYASWYSTLWLEEPKTLAAFRTLLGLHRFFGVPENETLVPMLAESASHQQEVTDQLGSQVRSAVEILIRSLDRADRDYGQKLLGDVPNETLYESALTVMMRLVFLFCAEERELLLLGDQLFDQHYAVSTLVAQLQETADQHGEEILERRFDAWCRLLSTFRAVYGGVNHDRMRLPAYSGNLFNPDRFPFLEGRKRETKWRDTPATPLPVNNRTVLHLLRSLQYLELHGEAQRLSFRALDIEQIGHVYEGLLDHTAKRAGEPVVGLVGKKEPEFALSKLEELRSKGNSVFFEFLKKETGGNRKWENCLDKELSTDQANRLRAACGNDKVLFDRILPFAGLVRDDSFDRPVVIRKGSVYVTAGTDRRSSGTHYTPRSLTEPIVQYTLEPLVYEGPAEGWPKEKWQLRTPKELLDLKICDMACGSGAFLVQACRYMSERLQEAWATLEREGDSGFKITPFGETSTGDPDEQLIPDDSHERAVYARRVVAQRCLYGVDINPLAVEMAKLSLWLLTLAKSKPFTFLDHSIRCGDSLVGISSIEQLERFSLNGKGPQKTFAHEQIKRRIDAAKSLRMQLERMPSNTVEDIERKTEMLARAEEQTARLRYAADMLLSVHWQAMHESVQERELEDTLRDVEFRFKDLPINELSQECGNALLKVKCPSRFHWAIEFPEVFNSGGFDAFVCNPPFLWALRISIRISIPFSHFLKRIWKHAKKNADLCSYFFLRASDLMRTGGTLGFIATNTISEADTKETTLDYLIDSDHTIFRAVSAIQWPGAANVSAAAIHICRGTWNGDLSLDGQDVDSLSTSLESIVFDFRAEKLIANQKRCFKGSVPLGDGFFLSPEEADEIVQSDSKYSEVIFPYMTGQELNNSPTLQPGRLAIYFRDWSLNECRKFPICLQLIEERVKPERDKIVPTNNMAKQRRDLWWKFTGPTVDLYEAIANVDQVLVASAVSKHHAFAFVPATYVYSNALNVFAVNSHADFGLLQSSIHARWALSQGSKLETRPRYNVTDCFETFPFPLSTDQISEHGRKYDQVRAGIMKSRKIGMTTIYNMLCDSTEIDEDIASLRSCQIALDNAVLDVYGWKNVDLQHGFHDTKLGIRFTISARATEDVLQRLLKLNNDRFLEEVRYRPEGTKKNKAAKPKPVDAKPPASLFDHAGIPASFPADKRDEVLCGFLCGLVQERDDCPAAIYRNALVILWQFERFKDLLRDDAETFAKACKKLPKSLRSEEPIPWLDVVDHLVKRKAIVRGADQTIGKGEQLDDVQGSFPKFTKQMASLALKAALILREMQDANPDTRSQQEREWVTKFAETERALVGSGA